MGVWDYSSLREHIGHKIVCVCYGKDGEDPQNVAIECETCSCVLLDYDKPAKKNAWFVYILSCADGSFYTGATNDVKKRLEKHNQGKASRYTRGRTPCRLGWVSPPLSKSEALKLEHQVKQFSRTRKEGLCELALSAARSKS